MTAKPCQNAKVCICIEFAALRRSAAHLQLGTVAAYGQQRLVEGDMDVQSIGVVGAGQMGSGIAHVFALAGFDVLLTDVHADSLTAALALIDRNIERQVTLHAAFCPLARVHRCFGVLSHRIE